MNIAMEQTEEYVNGQLKNKYGDAFIRGNNGASWISESISLYLCISFQCSQYPDVCYLNANAVLYISTTKRTLTDGA
jgi:hypothetical protein